MIRSSAQDGRISCKLRIGNWFELYSKWITLLQIQEIFGAVNHALDVQVKATQTASLIELFSKDSHDLQMIRYS